MKVYHCPSLFKAVRLWFLLGGSVTKLSKGWGLRVSK